MQIHEFQKPIPVLVQCENNLWQEGYAIYVESSGMYENDCWTVVLCKEGIIRHFNTSQVKIHNNATFGIK